jgi:hypothetical protein
MDALVTVGIIVIIMIIVLPQLFREKRKALRIHCVSNLKQVGAAFAIWSDEHGGSFPMVISQTNGGTLEFASGSNVWRSFQIMSNELTIPKVAFCPAEFDRSRRPADNFGPSSPNSISFLSNSNVSFFVGVVSNKMNPQMFLAGDRNLSNDGPVKNEIFEITSNEPTRWTSEMHKNIGNILLADGSVQQLSISNLQVAIVNTGVATNHLQMPVLVP